MDIAFLYFSLIKGEVTLDILVEYYCQAQSLRLFSWNKLAVFSLYTVWVAQPVVWAAQPAVRVAQPTVWVAQPTRTSSEEAETLQIMLSNNFRTIQVKSDYIFENFENMKDDLTKI